MKMRIAVIPLLAAALIAPGCASGGSATTVPPTVAATATPVVTVTPTGRAPTPSTLGVQALDAPFDGPRGLARAADGTMYVTQCQWTFAAIYRIDPAGMVTRFAGTGKPGFSGDGGPATDAQLYCPAGIAIGPDGTVYFADHVNSRIRRVDAAGVITTFAGSAGLNVGAFDGDGGPATQATLQEPWGVAFDDSGRLYIADRDKERIRMVDTSGDITTVAGTGTAGSSGDSGQATEAQICPPVGVAISPEGNVIIPDACATTVRMVDGNGVITTIAETNSPDLVLDTASEGNAAFDASGMMLIQSGPRVLRIDSSGAVTTLAGNGRIGSPIDGSLAVNSPLPVEIWGLAADPDGNVYVADGATSVWRIDTDGVITRFAGKES